MDWHLLFVGSAITLFSTSLGALPALRLQKLGARSRNVLMGVSAGVMLAASAFSLISPSIDLATSRVDQSWSAPVLVGAIIMVGGLFLFLCDRLIPHEHFVSGKEGMDVNVGRIWLFIFAITLHNFPEGLAVGSGVGSSNLSLALPIIFGIGLQNLPEGFIVAAALIHVGYSRWSALGVAVATGVVEALSAVLGFMATATFEPLLPWALAFAGGAMLYVVIEEMIPEIQGRRIESDTTFSILFGFVFMMLLDRLVS